MLGVSLLSADLLDTDQLLYMGGCQVNGKGTAGEKEAGGGCVCSIAWVRVSLPGTSVAMGGYWIRVSSQGGGRYFKPAH